MKMTTENFPPIVIIKEKQALMYLRSHDFSFVEEKPMSELYRMLGELNIKPNLIQTGAISLQLCLDDRAEKIEQLAAAASLIFEVQVEKGLTLLTIRQFNNELLLEMTTNKQII
jgi:aspartate kinase